MRKVIISAFSAILLLTALLVCWGYYRSLNGYQRLELHPPAAPTFPAVKIRVQLCQFSETDKLLNKSYVEAEAAESGFIIPPPAKIVTGAVKWGFGDACDAYAAGIKNERKKYEY